MGRALQGLPFPRAAAPPDLARTAPPLRAPVIPAAPGRLLHAHEVLALQRSVGNRATARLLGIAPRVPAQRALQRVTYQQAVEGLPPELTDGGQGGPGSVLDRWLEARGAGAGKYWDKFLTSINLETLKEGVAAYSKRLSAEAGLGQPMLPIENVDELLVGSARIGSYVQARQKEGAQVGDRIVALDDAAFFEVYSQHQLAAYLAGKVTSSVLDRERSKFSESQMLAFMRFSLGTGIDRIVGFVSPHDRMVFIRKSDLTSHTVIHEAIHRYSSDAFADRFGKNVNEGATDALARRAMIDLGLEKEIRAHYPEEVNLMLEMLAAFDIPGDQLKLAYFHGSGLDDLQAKMEAKLGADGFAAFVAAGSATVQRGMLAHLIPKSDPEDPASAETGK
ncbi:MAG TPA: hypothetical protein VFE05_14915 [Longimicrobiaceae bacterium]|nr:hypothetical protein [Longimicrobiaceae bacterium]